MKHFYLIGLTGNLGSGKSTVRRLLEELGAHGIDADQVAHDAMRFGSPAWLGIVRQFGLRIVNPNGEINRKNLGTRVFSNPEELKRLEQILFPAVEASIKDILRHTKATVVVIEAIKLIEAGLHSWCDAVWIVTSKPEIQVERVARDRHMSVQDSWARLDAQGALDEKLKFATTAIDNNGDMSATRVQVQQAWDAIDPGLARDKTIWLYGTPQRTEPTRIAAKPATLEVRRAHKSDLDALSIALARRQHLPSPLERPETLARFGAHGYRIAVLGKQIVAFIAWDAENLVAVASEIWAEDTHAAQALPRLLAMIEDEARQLKCEVLLVVTDPSTPSFVSDQARERNYQLRDLKELHRVWRQVAVERVQSEDQVWVRLLRGELVKQPF